MPYSKQFISKVKAVYPDNKEMHKMAEEGTYFLGRLLDDSQQGSIPVDTILLATSLESLQKQAMKLKVRKEVYADWYDERENVQ